jgi:hypothetical protein
VKYPRTQGPKYPRKFEIPKHLIQSGSQRHACSDWVLRCLGTWVLLSGLWVFGSLGICEAAERSSLIPEAEVTALKEELAEPTKGRSAVEIRRGCKVVIRKIGPILEANPGAPNRYDLLEVLFNGQRRLLSLEMTEQNRDALFATCATLSEAPDGYAEIRLEADLLLSERDLAAVDALVAERVTALRAIIAKYRGTSAELHSLTIAALIAAKLQDFDLEQELHRRLSSRSFSADHKAIAFRRRSHTLSRLAVMFGGTYESLGGLSIRFPFDRLGHQYLVIFWSLNSDEIEGYEVFLSRIREQQERFPGTFEVYSFNLDELPDAGQRILAKAGVNATALHLPGGRSSSAYRAYARTDPMAIFVSAQGHATLGRGQIVPWPRPSPARANVPASPGPGLGMWLDDNSYLGQLRSLFIGEFLVGSSSAEQGMGMGAIQSCFVPAPLRYRLTQQDALANYRRAEKLCAAEIKKHPKADDLWAVRNRRIVALLGMWKLACDSKYLDEAVEEAKLTLSMELPPGADVVARFCLATEALREGGVGLEALLKAFVDGEGGKAPPAIALAAAAIVAIEANAPALYEAYRGRFLGLADEDDPALWDVLSFLHDRQHNYRLFWPNPGRWGYTRRQRYQVRYLISGLDRPAQTKRLFAATLKELDGQDVRIPGDTAREMTGVIFAELPERDADRELFVKRVKDYASQFSKRDVPVVVAFLSDDVSAVTSLVKECEGAFRAAIVPGGLENPLVRRLGILAADRIPNPFLLQGDGTIAWSISGLTYPIQSGDVPSAVSASIGINIEKQRTDRAFEPLDQGDFKQAISLLDAQLPPQKAVDPWTHDRLHGRALARMGLKDWEGALKDIEAAQTQLGRQSRHGVRVHQGSAEMHLVRTAILKNLGRAKEAADELETGEKELAWLAKPIEKYYPPSYARNGVPVWVYTDLLKSVRLKIEENH